MYCGEQTSRPCAGCFCTYSSKGEQHIAAHVTLLPHKQCAEGVEIWLCTDAPGDQGGGDAWPGAVIPSELAAANPPEELRANMPGTEINASKLMWQFFKRYRLPAVFSK